MQAAAEFYEMNRRGLGVEFITEVERATRALGVYARIGHRFSRRLRRVLVRRFPYGLLYRVEREQIFVGDHGVAHFHAEYQGRQATFTVNGDALAGALWLPHRPQVDQGVGDGA